MQRLRGILVMIYTMGVKHVIWPVEEIIQLAGLLVDRTTHLHRWHSCCTGTAAIHLSSCSPLNFVFSSRWQVRLVTEKQGGEGVHFNP